MRRIYEKENKKETPEKKSQGDARREKPRRREKGKAKETRIEKKKETRASRLYDIEIGVARDSFNASPIY